MNFIPSKSQASPQHLGHPWPCREGIQYSCNINKNKNNSRFVYPRARRYDLIYLQKTKNVIAVVTNCYWWIGSKYFPAVFSQLEIRRCMRRNYVAVIGNIYCRYLLVTLSLLQLWLPNSLFTKVFIRYRSSDGTTLAYCSWGFGIDARHLCFFFINFHWFEA